MLVRSAGSTMRVSLRASTVSRVRNLSASCRRIDSSPPAALMATAMRSIEPAVALAIARIS